MSNRAPEQAGGVPDSIAAIMAAIRQEVAGPAAGAVPSEPGYPGRQEEEPTEHPVAAMLAIDAGPGDPLPPAAGGVAPALPGVEATVRAEIVPLLKAWLDAHLPEIVETAVHAELRRLTGQA